MKSSATNCIKLNGVAPLEASVAIPKTGQVSGQKGVSWGLGGWCTTLPEKSDWVSVKLTRLSTATSGVILPQETAGVGLDWLKVMLLLLERTRLASLGLKGPADTLGAVLPNELADTASHWLKASPSERTDSGRGQLKGPSAETQGLGVSKESTGARKEPFITGNCNASTGWWWEERESWDGPAEGAESAAPSAWETEAGECKGGPTWEAETVGTESTSHSLADTGRDIASLLQKTEVWEGDLTTKSKLEVQSDVGDGKAWLESQTDLSLCCRL